MEIIVQIIEPTALLVPDLQTLALSVPVIFSLYGVASALGLGGTWDTDSTLLISFAFGYLATVAWNIFSTLRPRSA